MFATGTEGLTSILVSFKFGWGDLFSTYEMSYFQKNTITSVIFPFHEGHLELAYKLQ